MISMTITNTGKRVEEAVRSPFQRFLSNFERFLQRVPSRVSHGFIRERPTESRHQDRRFLVHLRALRVWYQGHVDWSTVAPHSEPWPMGLSVASVAENPRGPKDPIIRYLGLG